MFGWVRCSVLALTAVSAASGCGPTPAPDAEPDNGTTAVEAPAEDSTSGTSTGVTPLDLPPADADSSVGDPPPLWDECPFPDGVGVHDPEGPYPFCQPDARSGWEFWCAPQSNGHGYMNWHADPGGQSTYCAAGAFECNACMCRIGCDPGETSSCPEPTSGTALPVCDSLSGGTCILDCADGQSCPDGMQCVHNLELVTFVCAWTSQGERCERP